MRYKIRQPTEEAACTQCGCPLYVGDWAHEFHEIVFCSKQCSASFARDHCQDCGASRKDNYPDHHQTCPEWQPRGLPDDLREHLDGYPNRGRTDADGGL